MPNMFRNFSYPGSDFHEMNLEWLFDACCRNTGLALNVSGNALRLVNSDGEVLSSVIVSYAEKALTDKNGKDISTYIFSVAGVGDTLVFTKGDGTITSVTVPYADKAKYDIDGHELEDYIYNVQVAGDKIRVTHGDGTIAEITVPYAVKATNDEEGKDITTYAASLTVEGDAVVLRDSKGRLLNSITVPYATKALQDVDGDAIKSTYAGVLATGTTTVSLKAKDGTVLSTITVPYATEANHAVNADLATVATDCTNAVENVAVSGDQIVFTTYGGNTFNITSPYSVKAQKDDNGNVIKTTYVANVTQDSGTGELQFRDALGNVIVTLVPVAGVAIKDDYNNNLADYIKSIVVNQNADYITVTHGTGTSETLTVHYAETAWKDTNNNVIKNTYVKYMECVEDVDDGHYKIVCYNGDNPMAELFRFEVTAYSAQTDINGKALTSYVADVDYNASKEIEVTDGEGNVLKTLANKVANIADVNLTTPADGDVLSYDANADEWVNTAGGGLQPYTGTSFAIGQWMESSNTYIADMYFNQDSRWSQDASWFRCLTPYVTYTTSGDSYVAYLQSADTQVEYMPGSWISGELMGNLRWAINSGLNLKSKAYFSIPNAPDKLVEVTLELTGGAVSTNTAQIVSAGADLPYIVLGDFTNGTYTPVAGATILANADRNKTPAITIYGKTFITLAMEGTETTGSAIPITDRGVATLLKQAADGTLVDPCNSGLAFIGPGNTWYQVQLVFFNNDLATNTGTQV